MNIDLPSQPHEPIVLCGRFDAHEAARFRADIEPFLSLGTTDVRVDLSGVQFIDSTALSELVRAMHRARATGHDLLIVALSTPVRVIFELTRLDRALTLVDRVTTT